MQKVLIIIFFLLSIKLAGQIKPAGTPYIQNYPKSEYDAGNQNWAITQDKNGFMYFANNDGVLQFDGLHWNLIKVSETSPVRSIFTDSQNKIYIGLFNDFGIMEKTENGRFSFKSLRHLLPENVDDFDDIWKIHEIPEGIIFQSYDGIFIYKNNSVEVIEPQNKFHYSFVVNNRLFVQEPGIGLFEYSNGILERASWDQQLSDKEIWSIMPYQETNLLIGTAGEGIFVLEDNTLKKWKTPSNQLIEEYKLFSAAPVGNNYIAFGTISGGVVISNESGEIIQHINMEKGLQNNTVLSLYTDDKQNLWLGLDNGIDYIEINSPISFLLNNKGFGTGYTCHIFDNKTYVGTNQGLFVKPFDNFTHITENFQLVENTTGQVWFIDDFNGQLICGHNSGTFTVNGNKAKRISSEEGAWKYLPLQNHPDLLLGGHYNGLALLKKEQSGWKFLRKIKGFNESSRYLVQHTDGSIWMSHGAKGIFRLRLNAELDSVAEIKLYKSNEGLPSDLNNIVLQLNDKIYAATAHGIYEYSRETDSFVVSDEMNNLLNIDSQLKIIKKDKQGNIWFIASAESGVLRLNEDLTYTKITSPFKQLDDRYVNEFEFIYPYSQEYVFLGIDEGFALYSSEFTKSYSQPFPSFITMVEMPYIDSTLHLLNTDNPEIISVPYKKNAFRFHYTAPFYEHQNQLEFSYMIENFTDEWSPWTENSFKDFTNLPAGNYVFKLKARNIYDVESSISTFEFIILPPWYKSITAYYIYFVVSVLLIYLLINFIIRRLEKAKKKEKERHLAELKNKTEKLHQQGLMAEKEIIRLNNEKLQNEMIFRDKELANQTMSIIQKNKFLGKLKDELKQIQKNTEDDQLKTKMIALLKKINKEIDNKQQNQVFETYFDEVHDEFFKRLKKKYPQISPREMRLCAYIRMNLTSKEIATLLNITERGVEVSRYRLRKKLDLPREINFSTFLSNI